MNRFTKCLTVMLAVLCLLTSFVTSATAATTVSGTGEPRYNIMLVIDGSGSLTSKNAGNTDPKSMRYELIGELMAMMADDGHNMGAIVFSGTQSQSVNPTDEEMERGIMLNTGLMPVDEPAKDGRSVKGYLEDEIKRVGVDLAGHGCTDIGTALNVAQKALLEKQQENGLESIVFLFTDGNTAFFGNPEGVLRKSQENRDAATRSMSENGIRLFTAFLNNGGNFDGAEMKRLVCAANGISTDSAEFQYSYVEINSAASMHSAFDKFKIFLGLKGIGNPVVTTEDLHDTFVIPGLGVEEMNIRLTSPNGEDLPNLTVTITQPDGTMMNATPQKQSRTYCVYKLLKPAAGQWKLDITVPKGNILEYQYDPVISLYVDSVVTSDPAVDQLCVNREPAFTCQLAQNGVSVADPAAYQGYTCTLEMKNVTTGTTENWDVTMNSSGQLIQTVPLTTYGTFEVRTIFTCGDIVVRSEPLSLDLTNRVPETQKNYDLDLKCGLFQPSTTKVELKDAVVDPEDGTNLVYMVQEATCSNDAYQMQGQVLTLRNSKVGGSTLVLTAMDTQGAVGTLTMTVNTTNVTLWYVLAILAVVIILTIMIILHERNKRANLPEGELLVSFDMVYEGKPVRIQLNLDVPGVDTTHKTDLNRLLQNALRVDEQKITGNILAENVKEYLSPMLPQLRGIGISATVKKKGKGKVGAVAVQQGKSTSVIYGSFREFMVLDVPFTLEFKPVDTDQPLFGDDGFGGMNNDFDNYASAKYRKQENNLFDDFDDFGSTPKAPQSKKKSASPAKQPDNGDFDLF